MALRPRDGEFPHIEIERQADEPERRRKKPFFPPVPAPPDRRGHATTLQDQTARAVQETVQHRESLGIDPNRLVVLEFGTVNYDSHDDFVERFHAQVVDEGVSGVAEQTRVRTVVQFPSEAAIRAFESEISAYRGQPVPRTVLPPKGREKFFDSLQQVRNVSAEDRMGKRVRTEGFPAAEPFFLDVDLWRPEDDASVREVLAEFRSTCQRAGCLVTDEVRTASLLLLKVQSTRTFAEQLLGIDLVARVDLPPHVAAGYTRFFEDFPPLDQEQVPDESDPMLCVVDSGVVSGHPFLRNWVVAERDFDSGENSEVDQNGHGTSVAGLAVYGDIANCIETGRWQPKVRICSAKVLRNEENPIDPSRPQAVFPDQNRIEHTIEEAIRHFHDEWGCRVFNLSVGDDLAPYEGGRQFPWAEKLDELARELDIVIVVAAGNRYPEVPAVIGTLNEIQCAVRDQTLAPEHRVCNPGTAALAITVGSIARNDAMTIQLAGRTLSIRDSVPGAPRGGPSPFTRTGPGCRYRMDNRSIKPDLADYGGNYALQQLGQDFRWNDWHFLVGEPTIIREQNGRFVGSRTGTSFSCPHVAHAASLAERSLEQLLGRPPSANLIRSLVASTARVPACGDSWLVDEETALRLVGYGQPMVDHIAWSSEQSVQLVTETDLEEDRLHFYKVPVPPSFLATKGRRGITVALAYDPPVRSSRKEYLARTMFVDVLQGLTTQEVSLYKARFQGGGQPPSPPSGAALAFRPAFTIPQWSTLQVRQIEWVRTPRLRIDEEGDQNLHIVVGCQRRFPTGLDSKQGYGLVANFWHSGQEVQLYQELRAVIRQPVRVRVQP
ncbi:MAG: S8 family peptidase [Bryobacteraceae bacterium]|jgi:enamine deaminase RidA (YjgF/YER057c/UK114 family)